MHIQVLIISNLQIKPPTQEPCYGDEVDMLYISSLCQNLFRYDFIPFGFELIFPLSVNKLVLSSMASFHSNHSYMI